MSPPGDGTPGISKTCRSRATFGQGSPCCQEGAGRRFTTARPGNVNALTTTETVSWGKAGVAVAGATPHPTKKKSIARARRRQIPPNRMAPERTKAPITRESSRRVAECVVTIRKHLPEVNNFPDVFRQHEIDRA